MGLVPLPLISPQRAARQKPNRKIDLLLIGCGTLGKYIEPNIFVQLREALITAEAMDTGAACRTFNVLIAEDRRVAAALIPV